MKEKKTTARTNISRRRIAEQGGFIKRRKEKEKEKTKIRGGGREEKTEVAADRGGGDSGQEGTS